jgi:hypothetical protein
MEQKITEQFNQEIQSIGANTLVLQIKIYHILEIGRILYMNTKKIINIIF